MLTVLLPTHNGSDTLERTLSAFSQLTSPNGGWKLVIINNASTDNTDAIVRRWMDRLPIEYLLEPRRGKPIALNHGFDRVEGDFLVMTDDDVLPDPTWLVEWRRMADEYPSLDIFGGAIEPEFEVPPPPWVAASGWTIVLYSATAPGRPEGPMVAADREVYGANIGVRPHVIQQIRFDERFMSGTHGLMGEDTDFIDRVAAAGFQVGFAAKARVKHIIQREQVTRRWMIRRFYRHGRAMYTFDALAGSNTAPRLFGTHRYLIRRIATQLLTLPLVALTFSDFRLMQHVRLLAYDCGAVRESLRQPRNDKPPKPSRRIT